MDEPNLQCVPRPDEVTLDPSLSLASLPASGSAAGSAGAGGGLVTVGGAAGGRPPAGARVEVCNIRSAFVAAPGCVLLAADYCQIELRLMAHFSQVRRLPSCYAG